MPAEVQIDQVEQSIERFMSWLEQNGQLSYDRMDFWGSQYGITAKKIFYKHKLLGAPLAAMGLLFENFFPGLQKVFSEPHREVIGDAHLVLSYLNLYEREQKPKYLRRAEDLMDTMLSYATKGYSGICWGYSFGWQTPYGYWKPGIPLITITPYAYWAFRKHFNITYSDSSKKTCVSIANFALKDLNEIKMPNGTWCASYSPISEDIVINANAYRAALLLDAYELSSNSIFKEAAQRNIEFVTSYQGEEGEWYYEAKPPEDNFIDNFHTCFVIKNLLAYYEIAPNEQLLDAINKGYSYYIKHLIDSKGYPIHFAKSKYLKFRKYEMYDFAEGIALGVDFKKYSPNSFSIAIDLASKLINEFQTNDGFFLTRVTSFNTKHKVPYIRWPQAQIFYALTKLLRALEN